MSFDLEPDLYFWDDPYYDDVFYPEQEYYPDADSCWDSYCDCPSCRRLDDEWYGWYEYENLKQQEETLDSSFFVGNRQQEKSFNLRKFGKHK